jgi:Bacterial regulatory proteins, gntR family
VSLDWSDLIAVAREQGWREERRTRHIWLYSPDGRGTACIPTSTSDWRAIHNAVAQLRRLGLAWGGRRTSSGQDLLEPPDGAGEDEASTLARIEYAMSVGEAVYCAIVGAGEPLSATDLSASTGFSRSTIRPALQALAAEGFLVAAGTRTRDKRGVRPDTLYAVSGAAPAR